METSRADDAEDDMRDDFELAGHGTVYLLRPLTPAAQAWDEHLPTDATWLGGTVIVEHRYIGNVGGGTLGDGLRVR